MPWTPIYPFPQNVLLTEAGADLLTEAGEVLLVQQNLAPSWAPIDDNQTPGWTPVVT